MTALFRGTECESFIASGAGVTESTASSMYNSALVRCAIKIESGDSLNPDIVYAETESWSAQTGDLWFHFEEAMGTPGVTTHNVLALYSGTTQNIRLRRTDDSPHTWTLQYLNAGAVWTTVGSAVQLALGRADYDINVNITTGVVALYVRGSASAAAATGLSLGHMSGITKARLYSDFFARYFSQIIVDTDNTIGWRLASAHPNGAGSDTAWTGSYASVDETVLSDIDFVNSATATQVSTFALSSSTLTSYSVRDVTVTFRGKKGASGPTKIQAVLRSAGTNYFSADIAQTTSYVPYHNTWTTDPATGSPWIVGSIAALQAGVKSIT